MPPKFRDFNRIEVNVFLTPAGKSAFFLTIKSNSTLEIINTGEKKKIPILDVINMIQLNEISEH